MITEDHKIIGIYGAWVIAEPEWGIDFFNTKQKKWLSNMVGSELVSGISEVGKILVGTLTLAERSRKEFRELLEMF